MFSIACGYRDANDSARLASDPIHNRMHETESQRQRKQDETRRMRTTLPRSCGRGIGCMPKAGRRCESARGQVIHTGFRSVKSQSVPPGTVEAIRANGDADLRHSTYEVAPMPRAKTATMRAAKKWRYRVRES